MNTGEGYIRVGYFEDFRGEDSVLFSVDTPGLLQMEQVFLRLSENAGDVDFAELKGLDTTFRIPLRASVAAKNEGLTQAEDGLFVWKLTREKWREFRAKMTTMLRNGSQGHHYLDADAADNGDLQVVVSWNEYPLSFWEQSQKP